MSDSRQLVTRLSSFCPTLRDDGLSYSDYVEQLTFPLFLKMADEQTHPPFNKNPIIPAGYDWQSLIAKDGDDLENHYRHTLEKLANEPGMLGLIFKKAQNKITEPAILRRIIADLINSQNWSSMSADVKGDAYEGLLHKYAEDSKSGAGQYFTPRALIQAVVQCVAPSPGETICDPAAGTGGFLLAAHEHLITCHSLDKAHKRKLRSGSLTGIDVAPTVARLCAMNLLLHGMIAPHDTHIPIATGDALKTRHGEYDIVLANPPFGVRSSITVSNEEGDQERESLVYSRSEFWATTSNKQLNFVQHIFSILKQHGRAAVVVPDNVLFEAGAGEVIRRALLHQANVHTLLRLPTGIFYKPGVKANVIFFERKPARETPWTEQLWIYDLRTNVHFTLKQNPMKRTDLDDFVDCFSISDRSLRTETERFRCFSVDDLLNRERTSLDIFWLKDETLEDSASLPPAPAIAQEIEDDLTAALEQIAQITDDLADSLK
jgi:type I restriction enzyme M protein